MEFHIHACSQWTDRDSLANVVACVLCGIFQSCSGSREYSVRILARLGRRSCRSRQVKTSLECHGHLLSGTHLYLLDVSPISGWMVDTVRITRVLLFATSPVTFAQA